MTDRKDCIKNLKLSDFNIYILDKSDSLDQQHFNQQKVQDKLVALATDFILSNNISQLKYVAKKIKTNYLVSVFLESLSIGSKESVEIIYSQLLNDFGGNYEQIFEHTRLSYLINPVTQNDMVELLPILKDVIFDDLETLLWHPSSSNISTILFENPKVQEYIKSASSSNQIRNFDYRDTLNILKSFGIIDDKIHQELSKIKANDMDFKFGFDSVNDLKSECIDIKIMRKFLSKHRGEKVVQTSHSNRMQV